MTAGQRNAHIALSELLQQSSLPDVLYALGEVLRERCPERAKNLTALLERVERVCEAQVSEPT